MKSNFPRVGLAKICGWFGITRQAYYKNQNDRESKKINAELVLNQVKKIRLNHKRIGTRKLFSIMEPFKADHKIKMGRVLYLIYYQRIAY
jgi:putative transposase